MTFLDLFAGIGGFRLGMTMAGHKPVGWVEWDKFARKSYETMYDTKGEWTAHDITKVSDDDIRSLRGRVDVITGGFPCQAFSIAGQRKGFQDTRGTLFFDIARFANILRPRYLFLENVKGLLNHDNGNTFETIIRTLDELGYDAEWDVLNSKDFGVPQNRERVFIIGHLRGERTRKVFPIKRTNSKTLKQIVGGSQGMRVYDPNGLACTQAAEAGGLGAKTGLYAVPVLTPDREKKRQNGRRFKESGEPMFTLTSQDRHGIMLTRNEIKRKADIYHTLMARDYKGIGNQEMAGVMEGARIRRLTPKECWRLQGFPDELFEKAAKVNSDSQLYKQAGNSVTVNVIYEIAKKL